MTSGPCKRNIRSQELWQHAEDLAEQEMHSEFEFGSLCEQGKVLFERELLTKTRRVYTRLKERLRRANRKQQ